MTVEITEEIKWINECYSIGNIHMHISLYLLEYNDKKVLVDTGSFYHRKKIVNQLEQSISGADIDAVFLSNAGFVHAGNMPIITQDSNVDIICFIGSPKRHGYSSAVSANPGDSLNIGNRKFSFIDPIVSDLGSCAWIYDHQSQGLFTSDGFGHYHNPADCNFTSEDFKDGIGFQKILEFQKDTLRWLQYADPKRIESAVSEVFNKYTVKYLLPVHGHPIFEGQIDPYIDSFNNSIREISNNY